MELQCLPSETPKTASSCSTDPLYDNCPPCAQRGRGKEVENRVLCLAITRFPGSRSPLPALTPAEVPTLGGEERGSGPWPDHNYCSWRGGLGKPRWETVVNRSRGGERGGEYESSWGTEDLHQSPTPSQSEEHRSFLSLYDNLTEGVTPDGLRELIDMETSFQEDLQERVYQAWAPEQIQGSKIDKGASDYKSTWSSCKIIFTNQDQDKKHEEERELDSGSCGFLKVPVTQTQLQLAAYPSQLIQTECHTVCAPAGVQHLEQPSWSPRVPPPIPLADPSASALRSLLTSLRQQIVKQREEYEARILSMEQRNEELQVEVFRLKSNLIQQRRWYQAVQAKIVEFERARGAAEVLNASLQREMDQLFDTFGELNNEAKKTEWIVKSY